MKSKTISKYGSRNAVLFAAVLCAMPVSFAPVTAGAVESDRITVEDPSTGAVKFKVTSEGNVTASQYSGDGALLSNVPHWKGTWNSGAGYAKDDCVFYGGSSWIALQGSTGAQPDLAPFSWSVMAQQGPAGAGGATGPQGIQGPAGPAGSPDTQADILTKLSAQSDGAVLTLQQGASTDQAGTVKFGIKDKSGAVKSVFTADGKLGIGTQAPASGLHVGGTAVSTGNNDGVAALVDTTLKAGKINDMLYGLKLAPVVNANGFINPLLYSLYLPGASDGIVRMRFDNTSPGTAAQAGIEMNNDAGQALFTLYSSKYSSATLQNYLYVKNAVGGVKFVAAPGSTVGFGIGTTAASANNIFIDSSSNVGIGTGTPAQKLEVKDGGMRINTASTVAKPVCSSSIRGTFWLTQKGAGEMDTLEVCVKNASEAYVWKAVW